ncbi:MAG TPA: 30S ribosomal protein S27ae [Candidatus Diapherotrites archaeon]|uniref:Small ribosomal subunit protein eS31 n=1 Tax=Candidatus Iainarchaeum sp. TaxID=3101447 RepID=A0A7J4JHZ9_9ARCH|nr:30S ribosomal protein S27ae [Candidatus Diapherotrites archaeon]HIH16229.1 30S ribosomal protein S27ae [Candidatus Diapherotrites archaeon]
MAEKAAAKAKEEPGKKLKATLYEVKGESLSRKTRSCPKCGGGIFMAAHKDRFACGKCSYTEFRKV